MEKKLSFLFLVLIVVCFMGINAFASEDQVTKDDIIDQKYLRFSQEGNFFVSFAVTTPELIKLQTNKTVDHEKTEPAEIEAKIKQQIDNLELNEGICVKIGILNKQWSGPKPVLSGISERIFIEDEKGNTYSPRKVISDNSKKHLEESLTLILSFPKKVISKDNKNFYVVIRGIDTSNPKEKQIKVEFLQDIVSYLLP